MQVLYKNFPCHNKIMLCKFLCKEDVHAKKIMQWKIMLDEGLLYQLENVTFVQYNIALSFNDVAV